MDEARRRGHAQAVLSAQTHAIAFYRRHGYAVVGGEYMDCGIPHVDMTCELAAAPATALISPSRTSGRAATAAPRRRP